MHSDFKPNPNHKKPVSCQPLHSGLGFHPFPDGLPYSAQKGQNLPSPSATRTNSNPSQGRTESSPLLGRPDPALPPIKKLLQDTTTPSPAPQKPIQTPALTLSYSLSRSLAYLLDLFIHSSLMCSVIALTLWFNEIDLRILVDSGMLPVATLFLVAFNWFLVMLQEVVFRTSLGKSVFRLSLPTSRLRILCRAILFVPSAALGVGIILGLFNPRKRCLHDLIVNAQPTWMTIL